MGPRCGLCGAECQVVSVVASAIVLAPASASTALRWGAAQPSGCLCPSLCLSSGSCGTVAVQGNLTV